MGRNVAQGSTRVRRLLWAGLAASVVVSGVMAAPARSGPDVAAGARAAVRADPPVPGARDVALCGYAGCRKDGEQVRVMTRNIFLGADLGPAFRATGAQQFVAANGAILRQVRATNMPVRARGLAREIRRAKPDLVGLQEAALWRTGPVDFDAALEQKPVARKVYQDFIALLMQRLNHGKQRYRVVHVANEFDFEAPADVDNDPSTGPLGADLNGRLTMRDAILVRSGGNIRIRKLRSGGYSDANSFHVTVAGLVSVRVVRGWLSLQAKVRQSPWFRFSNTHLEAFDDRTQRPSIRALQAQEFADKVGGGKMPNVAVGDFNSDYPGLVPGDEQAFLTLRRNGYRDRGTVHPLSCCIQDSYDLRTGTKADFDHRVDQVLSDTPRRVLGVNAWVTGRRMYNGYWNSDHAGVVSRLFVFRRPGK